MTISTLPRIKARNKEHLISLIDQHMKAYGNECDLNHIDTSEVTDMSGLFNYKDQFRGDISQWNTSNVRDMSFMFDACQFNGDISLWNTSKVASMRYMFCDAAFEGDLSQWSFDSLIDKDYMFTKFHVSPFGLDCKPMLVDAKLNQGYQNIAPDIREILVATEHLQVLSNTMSVRWVIYQKYQQFVRGELTEHPVHALSHDPLQKALLCYQMAQQRQVVSLSEDSTAPWFEVG